jgi:hypothetical protein
MNWIKHFTQFFEQQKDQITRIQEHGGIPHADFWKEAEAK